MLATGIVGAVEDPWIRWSWISGHVDVIMAALLQHIWLTLLAVVIGLAIAVPLGLVAWRSRVFRGPIFTLTGILYTIPSLALFAFLLPFTGLTTLTAEIGLVGYTLLNWRGSTSHWPSRPSSPAYASRLLPPSAS